MFWPKKEIICDGRSPRNIPMFSEICHVIPTIEPNNPYLFAPTGRHGLRGSRLYWHGFLFQVQVPQRLGRTLGISSYTLWCTLDEFREAKRAFKFLLRLNLGEYYTVTR